MLLAALSVALSSCTLLRENVALRMGETDSFASGPCRDLEVGDEVLIFFGPLGSYPVLGNVGQWVGDDTEREYSWSLSGAGSLEIEPVPLTEGLSYTPERGRFLATEVGESTVGAIMVVTSFQTGPFSSRVPVAQLQLTGSCSFSVVEDLSTAEPPIRSLPPGTLVYDITQKVVASDMGGVGTETITEWTFSFECSDGRCNADVVVGDSASTFTAVFSPSEDYSFETVNESGGCTRTIRGSIEPVEWSDVGPLQFVALWTSTTQCGQDATAAVVVEWESVGQLR